MSRNLFIPEIGDAITLAEDWTFTLYAEGRNLSLWKVLGLPELNRNEHYMWDRDLPTTERLNALSVSGVTLERNDSRYGYSHYMFKGPGTLAKGTVLTVDRIYIRKGISEFSSITFVVRETTLPHKGQIRFWAKLADVNKLIIEDGLAPPTPKQVAKKRVRYAVWIKYSDEQIKNSDYVRENIRQFERSIARGERWMGYGPAWMHDPRYYSHYTETVRPETEFVDLMKKKYGTDLKAITQGYTYDRIYEAP